MWTGRHFFLMGTAAFLACSRATAADPATLEPAPPSEPSPIQFQVVQRREIDLGNRSLILNRVAPPALPPKPAAPTPQAIVANVDEAVQPAKKTTVLFLSATVYDRKVTQISFFGAPGKGAIFSNIDFNLLEGMGNFETNDTVYTLMLAVSNQSAEDAAARNQQLAAQGAEMAWARIPQVGEFSMTRSECIVVEDAAHPAPTGEELAALHALHVFFDANKQTLAAAYHEREAKRIAVEQWRVQHPPVPRDVVVHYWRKPSELPKKEDGK